MHTISRKYTLYVIGEDKKINIRRFVPLQNNVKNTAKFRKIKQLLDF